MNSGKCPKCEKVLTYVSIEEMPVHVLMAKKWRGCSFLCPHCKTILNVCIDQLTIRDETLDAISKKRS